MFITDGVSNYDRVCTDLVAIVQRDGAGAHAPGLGGAIREGTPHVPLFGNLVAVTNDGVFSGGQRFDTMGSILVLRYLLTGGTAPVGSTWTPYRDLKDGSRFSSYIKARIEDRLALVFAGKRDLLKERLQAIGAEAYKGDVRGDLAMILHPLPRIPVLCLFWDRDEEFEASLQFLFDASASSYLDLESLAALLEYIYLKVTEAT